MPSIKMNRREALGAGIATTASLFMPAISYASSRPVISHGLQSGDISHDGAVLWAKADRVANMKVEIATTDSFSNARVMPNLGLTEATDFSGKMTVSGLPADQDIFYRVTMLGLDTDKAASEAMVGQFRTAPMAPRDISFVWSGDTAGQGWGIDEDRGGMVTYKTMLGHNPDFFIHSGDTVYADNPMEAAKEMPDGGTWKNVMIDEKAKVAESLHEYRYQYLYNLMDTNVRAFNAQVPMLAQWDDHELTNNWYPNEILEDDRYTEKSVAKMQARAARAFHEMMPLRTNAQEPHRIYRKVSYGPLLDIFFLDMRSYRADNGANNQTERGAHTQFLGAEQLAWLKRELINSNATWKIMASDMPIGMIVYDNWREKNTFENMANGDGPVMGREFDIAEMLSFMKHANIQNVVWLTADVHYTAAHHYSPERAQFQDFNPFWEFVSGPLHAGTFGPNEYDNTFGPKVEYAKAPTKEQGINLPPSMGLQFFGKVDIEAASGEMTVSLLDVADEVLWSKKLTPAKA